MGIRLFGRLRSGASGLILCPSAGLQGSAEPSPTKTMQSLSSLFFVSAAVRDSILSEFSACPGSEGEYIPFEVKVSKFSWEVWVYLINGELMFDPWLIGPVNHDRSVRSFIGRPISGVNCLI